MAVFSLEMAARMNPRERAVAKARETEYKVEALAAYNAKMEAMRANNAREELVPRARRRNESGVHAAEEMMMTREATGARDAARKARQLEQDDKLANEVGGAGGGEEKRRARVVVVV